MSNNIANPFVVSDGTGSTKCVVQNPTTAYTVGAEDNVIICGANSVAVTLTSTSNSPVVVTSVDGGTQRTGCTIVFGSRTFTLTATGCTAYCVRYGPASQNLWITAGATTGS